MDDTTTTDQMLQRAILDGQALVGQLQQDLLDPTLTTTQVSAARQALAYAQSSLIALQSYRVSQPKATYTVIEGDTLFLIAQNQLGDALRYTEITKANDMMFLAITPGQSLKMPK